MHWSAFGAGQPGAAIILWSGRLGTRREPLGVSLKPARVAGHPWGVIGAAAITACRALDLLACHGRVFSLVGGPLSARLSKRRFFRLASFCRYST